MKRLHLLVLIITLLASPVFAQPATDADCVDAYDPAVDYFPDKAALEYAVGFSIEYFGNYKLVTVRNPWPNATEADAFQYVLVQCGTPAPDIPDATVIEIPAQRVIAMSTTFLPHFAELGQIDRLIGVDSLLYVNSPAIVEKGANGGIVEVGFGADVNVEVVIDSEADLVLTYGSGSPEFDAYPVLTEAGVPVVVSADWMETTPLGRAEWIKFNAALLNAEADANAAFDAEAARYNMLADMAASHQEDEKPTVLWGSYFGDSWAIPGGQSYAATLLRDAGARPVLADSPEAAELTGSALFDFETVYDAGLNADFWIPLAFAITDLDSFLALDARYGDFAAAANQRVWNNDARVNANGGNDYYESGVTQPSDVLADLIAIFHPDLLPDHELVYFRNLN